uniref:Uncharacterized protein n=1 Tax=Salmonella sp. TaxID=599 RepID=A0A482ETS8_SALSP|nr:hypothetical protein NNIBIDOC_00224 [Salmonella sp.]
MPASSQKPQNRQSIATDNPENVDVNTGSPSSLLERLIAINDSG